MGASLLSSAVAAAWWSGVGAAALAVAGCSGTRAASHGSGGGAALGSSASGVTAARVGPTGPHLVVPAVIDIPYVVAGKGGVTAAVPIANDGDVSLTGLVWTLGGDPSISLGAAPAALAPGEKASLQLTWTGSPTEAIVQANLSVMMAGSTAGSAHRTVADIPVFAVAGDPDLGSATWDAVEGAGGVIVGMGVTVAMPAAPYPAPADPGRPDGAPAFTDPSVRVFVPEGYRDRGAQDVVLHFHGWNTTLAATLAKHLYQQHLYASGSNAVLVVPQGPVDAPSGDFGKLMGRGGISRLLTEVMVLLYRDGKITHPVCSDLVITAHSGGYQAAAASLDPANQGPRVAQVDLFDALYGYETVFQAFALGGGTLRSNYTESGGTFDVHQNVVTFLSQRGLKPALEPTQRALREDAPVLDFAATSHVGTTRLGDAYGERLRWRLRHSRRGPRIELREVIARVAPPPAHPAGSAIVRWLAPVDEDVTGFVVEASDGSAPWTVVATATAGASEASFPLPNGTPGALPPDARGVRVRVKAVVTGVDPADVLPSDTYRVDPRAAVLVVDGFDRVLDGAFGGLQHDFAAVVGEAVGPVASISHRAVLEDGFDLTPWPAVVWLLGDASAADGALSAAEQQALLDYLDGGGHLVMSGSELAFDLGQTEAGALFLERAFGAAFLADDAESHEVSGRGPLEGLASVVFGGRGAPYVAASPDALAPAGEGAVLLEYGSAKAFYDGAASGPKPRPPTAAAAVGLLGRGVLVGFPLELVGPPPDRAALIMALLAFAGS